MPFINIKTNVTVSKEKSEQIKSSLGKSISLLPGKSETWLMIEIEQSQLMYFQGSNNPCAMVKVDIYGSSSKDNYNKLASAITSLLNEELDINSDRIYVRFEEVSNWSYSGSLF